MVENAYKVTLVAAIVPLAFGLYWHRATSLGATLAIVLGLATWINLEIINPERPGAAAARRPRHEPRRHDRRLARILRRRAEGAAHQLVRAR